MTLVQRAAISFIAAAVFSLPPAGDGFVAEAAAPIVTAQLVPKVQGGTIPPQSGPNCRIQRTRYCKIGVDCPSPLLAACVAPSRPVTHDGTVYCERLVCN